MFPTPSPDNRGLSPICAICVLRAVQLSPRTPDGVPFMRLPIKGCQAILFTVISKLIDSEKLNLP